MMTTDDVFGGWPRSGAIYIMVPDPTTADVRINSLVILFEPDTNSGSIWVFDNLDTYAVALPRRTIQVPPPAETRVRPKSP